MSLHLLSLLKAADPTRHKKAVSRLADESLTVALTKQTNEALWATVSSREHVYGVHLAGGGGRCDCADATWRGVTCLHQLATAIYFLQPKPEPIANPIHLIWADDTVLCGAQWTSTLRTWKRWTLNALNWSDLVCQDCVSIYRAGHNRHLEMQEAA